jgi:hypothetical protein
MFLLSGNLLAQSSNIFIIDARIVFISSNSSLFSILVPKRFLMTIKFYSGSDNTKLPPKAKSKAFLYQGAKP